MQDLVAGEGTQYAEAERRAADATTGERKTDRRRSGIDPRR
jgi:hypothetical protein